jgi:ATP phosphoribosyltransferase regulatory subunit
MTDILPLDNQVPIGFTDLFMEEASRQLWLIQSLRDLFSRWGYDPVIPPTVAYAEGLSTDLVPYVYRFFDREGHTLALRADLTLPVARIVGTRLYDQPLPLRLCYVEHVFRHVAPQAGQRREFTQAGVELIGADTPQADAEVIALAADALHTIGVQGFSLAVGQMAFFAALLGELDLPEAQIDRVKEAIDRRNDLHLRTVLQETDLPPSMHTLLRALPRLTGGREVIARARDLAPIREAHDALDRLEDVLDRLDAYGLSGAVLVDLGEVRGMDYYTGIVFQGYASGIGSAVCSGGRYDNLIHQFGPDLPAVGFGMDIGLIRLAAAPHIPDGPAAIVQNCGHARCCAIISRMRRHGLRVIVDALGRADQELVAYAGACGARAVICRGDSWQVIAPNGSAQVLETDQIEREYKTW